LLISSILKLLVSALLDQRKMPQTLSEEEWSQRKLSTLSCGNVTHGEEREPVISVRRRMKPLNPKNWLLLRIFQMLKMSAIVSVTATLALVNIKVSNADGALVVPSATEVLERLHTNAVDLKLEPHSTSPAQLTSELLIARVTHATGQPRNAQWALMDNSQMLNPATMPALRKFNSPSATKIP